MTVYVIMATSKDGLGPTGDVVESTWVHCICRDTLTAEETCAKMNLRDDMTEYYIEEHVLYD